MTNLSRWLAHQRPSMGQPLLLAACQAIRLVSQELLKVDAHELCRDQDVRDRLLRGAPLRSKREAQVVESTQVWIERIALQDMPMLRS
jgi:hypothetical protein